MIHIYDSLYQRYHNYHYHHQHNLFLIHFLIFSTRVEKLKEKPILCGKTEKNYFLLFWSRSMMTSCSCCMAVCHKRQEGQQKFHLNGRHK